MTSSKTLLPMEQYRLPFCQPEGGPKLDNQNLGEFLAGDRIESSPFRLNMKVEMYCEQLCVSNLGRGEQQGISPNKVVQAIRKNYHNNWIVDNLPPASKVEEDDDTVRTRYFGGIPIGYVDPNNKKSYIYNHVNIEIMYHPVETDPNKYHIVRFIVEPFSIMHQFEVVEDDNDNEVMDKNVGGVSKIGKIATFTNPIASCTNDKNLHTYYDMIKGVGREGQLASGQVLFTYDVIWVENEILKWPNRWDIYLSMDNAIPHRLHRKSIYSACLILIILIFRTIIILRRNLRCGFDQYSRLKSTDENAEDFEEFGWKLLHANVFRPPSFSPLLLSCACGTGAQILVAALFTLVLSAMGFLSAVNKGALRMAQLGFYLAMGGVGGYVTARLDRTFQGNSWIRAATCTTFGFPGLVFSLFFGLNVFAVVQGSSYAVPPYLIGLLVIIWFGISVPLVFSGAYFGNKHGAIDFPVETSLTPREIPDQPWFLCTPLIILIGGVLPFGICFIELFFIIQSTWADTYYDATGILLCIFLLLLPIVGATAILSSHLQLGEGNYRWWWRSFCVAGSTAIYMYFYSCLVYFSSFRPILSVFSIFFFFGYMGVILLGVFLMTGFVGVAGSWYFHHVLYSSLKID